MDQFIQLGQSVLWIKKLGCIESSPVYDGGEYFTGLWVFLEMP
jgi:hypothetical protein